ncbi:hypothetical protein PanWU01x14_147320 [Parasponia andersonii]|uniref:Uncharacterized protein n=1 Tax=Parasponia andersonii TaxID=3476 RepID=A0A2P5CK21_PARAD|nr:hypothetical protein PanWU01x14_147320 [Parasponia andersonii]
MDEGDRDDHNHVIDIDSIISSMISQMVDDSLTMSTGFSIFRIPTAVSRHNEKAYMPSAFSIGPFHHGKDHLKPAERIKWKYLLGLIARLATTDTDRVLKSLTTVICNVQREARCDYAGPIGLSDNEFVKVLVLDGCFIIELFRKKAYPDLIQMDDPIFTVSRMLQFLYHDLILLENQIPWLVLENLFGQTKISSVDKKPLVELAIEFFGDIFPTVRPPPISSLLDQPHIRCKHILDQLRNSLVLPSSIRVPPKKIFAWQPMPSASSLKEAGIILRRAKYSDSILDVEFRNGVLEIPSLLINENTEALFLNLISLELYSPNYGGFITSYALLFDNLIQTTTDMKILCDSQVIRNWLHLEDATRIFNHSYEDYACVRDNYYALLAAEVDKYCQTRKYYYVRRWQVYRGELKRVYFRHPWALISTIAASVMLILTFLQTLFTFLYK